MQYIYRYIASSQMMVTGYLTYPEVKIAIIIVTSQNFCVTSGTYTDTLRAQSVTRVTVLHGQRQSGCRALGGKN